MTSKVQATFMHVASKDGWTVLQCRETGTRYSFLATSAGRLYSRGDRFPVYRETEIACYRMDRNGALAFIESDSRWQIRDEQRTEREQFARKRLVGGMNPSGIWL